MKQSGVRPEIHAAIANLQRLAELFRQRRGQLAQEAGLTEQQWHVLEEIATEHFMPSLFAKHRKRTPAAVSRVIRTLLDRKLISVSVSAADGRQRTYVLTPRGTTLLDGLRESRRRAIDTVWMDLPAADLAAFTRSSRALITRLEKYAARHRSAEE